MGSDRKVDEKSNKTNDKVRHAGWRLAAAGSLSGAFTNIVLHPLDTVKTVQQSNPSAFKGLAPATFAIVRARGPLALFAGGVPALIGSSISTALYFACYEFAKYSVSKLFPEAWSSPQSRIPLTAISGAIGNTASSVAYVPKEVLKQQMQTGEFGNRLGQAILTLYRQSGIKAYYRGYKATLLRNIPSAMIRFASYEEFKRAIRRLRHGNDSTRKLSPTELVVAGSLAGALSSACTTPMDVVKTGLATGAIRPGTSLPAAFQNILQTQGVPGLFVGIRPRVIWSAMFTALGFASYEVCKRWMTGQPTGLVNSVPKPRKAFALHNHRQTMNHRRPQLASGYTVANTASFGSAQLTHFF